MSDTRVSVLVLVFYQCRQSPADVLVAMHYASKDICIVAVAIDNKQLGWNLLAAPHGALCYLGVAISSD